MGAKTACCPCLSLQEPQYRQQALLRAAYRKWRYPAALQRGRILAGWAAGEEREERQAQLKARWAGGRRGVPQQGESHRCCEGFHAWGWAADLHVAACWANAFSWYAPQSPHCAFLEASVLC